MYGIRLGPIMANMAQTWFQVQYGIQCLSVVGDLLIQPSEVELILNVVLIHLWCGMEVWLT